MAVGCSRSPAVLLWVCWSCASQSGLSSDSGLGSNCCSLVGWKWELNLQKKPLGMSLWRRGGVFRNDC